MTDAQAGGRKGTSTVDHILISKEFKLYAKNTKKDIYIAFLNVTNAYDKAWLDAIMYVIYNEGLNDMH